MYFPKLFGKPLSALIFLYLSLISSTSLEVTNLSYKLLRWDILFRVINLSVIFIIPAAIGSAYTVGLPIFGTT